jgi:flagellar basal body rod protein FlgG
MLQDESGKATPVQQQQIDMTQGVLEPTGNPYDLGIKGKGFFVVEDGNGTKLTRDGQFMINADGYMVNKEGARVMGAAGPIFMPDYLKVSEQGDGSKDLEVAKDGTIRLNGEVYEKLQIVKVNDVSKLERQGTNYFTAPDSAITMDNESTVLQGHIESGNVDPLTEMVDMMQTSKLFETQQRAIRSSDEMLGRATRQLGSV